MASQKSLGWGTLYELRHFNGGKWCLSPYYIFDHLDGHETWYDKIECPLVSYSVENDTFAPKEAVDWFTSRFSNCGRKRIHIDPGDLNLEYIGHFGFFKKSKVTRFGRCCLKK